MVRSERFSRAVVALVMAAGLAVGPGALADGAAEGRPAPALAGTCLDGRRLDLAGFRGRNPVVVTFFQRFCEPCKTELTELKALDGRLRGKGLRIVAVALDQDRTSAAAVPRALGVRFPVVMDPGAEIVRRYGVGGLPYTAVIDRAGVIRTILVGFDRAKLRRAVDRVIGATTRRAG